MLRVDLGGGDRFFFERRFTLDGVPIILILRWLQRLERWSMQATDPQNNPLGIEQVACPGGTYAWDRLGDTTPGGLLLWLGPDPYGRFDLGNNLRLTYIEAAEIPGFTQETYRDISLALTPPGIDFSSTTVTWDSTQVTFDRT